jgi:CRISPR-associated protein Csd1
MILQALVKRYEDLVSQGEDKVPCLGWGKVKVSFGLNLNEDGDIEGLLILQTPQKTGKKEIMMPRTLEVPQPVKRAVNIKSNFLCDNSTYLFGVDEKGKPERSLQCFQACRELHCNVLEKVETPSARAVLRYFASWVPQQAVNQAFFAENYKELISGANILFYYDGKSVLEDEEIRRAWQEYYNKQESECTGICMVTGQRTSLAVLHPIIKGVNGAQAMGTSLVSFNAQAFCSYEKEQGENAPVGEYAAFAYAAALNELLNDREHRKTIGDATVVCWAEGGKSIYQDVGIAAMFGVEQEGGITEQELSMIFDSLRRGEQVKVEDEWLDTERHFYVLGLAPNAARLTVRFFLVDSFGNMLRHVGEHYKRLEIVKPVFDTLQTLSLQMLLSETVKEKAKDKSPTSQMAADTLQAVLMGKPYPVSLLNGVMMRIRAEKIINWRRAAFIKAYYLRNENKDCSKKEGVLEMELNEECVNVPYTLGRLFAVLEHVQQEANPGISTTIKDRYFNAAASTPAHVFPVLINLAQKHLRKLKSGQKVYFDKQIGELVELIGEEYPMHLNLPKQGSFQLGYYCQTQKRYQKKEDK